MCQDDVRELLGKNMIQMVADLITSGVVDSFGRDEIIEDVADTLAQAICDLDRWTAVSEGLPKPHEHKLKQRYVAVYWDGCPSFPLLGYYNHELEKWFIMGSPSTWPVTHWQEITPPEG